jgi:hypothetical protein
MALEPAGVKLTADGYSDYLSKLAEISRAQKAAFSGNSFKDYQKATDDIAQKTKQVNKALNETADAGAKSASMFSKFANALKPAIGNVGDLTGMITGMLAKFSLVAIAIKLVTDTIQFFTGSIAVAQRNETLAVSLHEIGTQAGYSNKQIELATKLLNHQGITTQAAQQSLMDMARANISWSEASHLATIAQGSAVVAGINSSEAFQRLVTGIQKQDTELLRGLGITIQSDNAYKAYAKTLGVTAGSLDDAQRKQAILNAIYVQAAPVMGVYNAALGTSGKQQASLARYIEETQNNLGKMLLPLAEVSVEMQTNFWKGAQTATKAMTGLGTAMGLIVDVGGKVQGALINAALAMLTFGQVKFDEKKSFAYKLGEGIFNFTKAGLINIGIFVAAAQVQLELLVGNLTKVGLAIQKLASFDPKGAWEVMGQKLSNPITSFQQNFDAFWKDVIAKNPDLNKSWAELNATIEGTPDDLKLPEVPPNLAPDIDAVTDALKRQIDVLEATKDAFNKAKDIQENYEKATKQAKDDYDKGMLEAEEKYQKEKAKKVKEFNQQLEEFDAKSARDRAKMIDDFNFQQANRVTEFAMQQQQNEQSYNLKVAQDKRKFYDDQKRALRDFQLSQMQESRRFQVTDRRLRADGDVLGLMEAREDFALQQQENQENFNNQNTTAKDAYDEQKRAADENFRLQEEQAKQSFAYQTEIQREEFQRRLQEFDENVALQREKMIAANAQEMEDLATKFEEEKAKLYEDYQNKLAMAEEQKNKELQALGDSLKEQGLVTEQGMHDIADKISKVFGSDEAGDQLIKGWSERTDNEFNNLVDSITTKINGLKAQLDSLKDDAAHATAAAGSGGSSPGAAAGYGPNPGTITQHMAQGGAGVVTGPANFAVEPGLREAYSFSPLGASGQAMTANQQSVLSQKQAIIAAGPKFPGETAADISTIHSFPIGSNTIGGNVNVTGSVNVNVQGMNSGNVSADVEKRISDSIANELISEIKVAVKQLNRRGG